MLFYFHPKNAFISDSNEQLIQTYLTVRNSIDEVIEVLGDIYERYDNDL